MARQHPPRLLRQKLLQNGHPLQITMKSTPARSRARAASKAYIASKVEVGLHGAIDAFLGDLPNRLATLDDEEYFETFRTLLATAEKAGLFRDRPQVGGGGEAGKGAKDTEGGKVSIDFHITPPVPPGTPPEERRKLEVAQEEEHGPSVFD